VPLQERVINAAEGVAPALHLRAWLRRAANFFVEESGGLSELDRLLGLHLQCPLASVYCLNRTQHGGHALLSSTVWVAERYALGGAVLTVCSGPLGGVLTGTLGSLAALAFPLVVLSHAYDMSLVCFARLLPLLPVCLADDAYEAVNSTLLPPQFPWPAGLWPDGNRGQAPVSCAGDPVGMYDGLRVLSYVLESRWPGWQAQAPLFTLSAMLGGGTVDSYAFYYADKNLALPQYAACAWVMSPTVLMVPLVLAPLLVLALYAVQALLVLYLKTLSVVGSLFDASNGESEETAGEDSKSDSQN
jgi:hypothetical protein